MAHTSKPVAGILAALALTAGTVPTPLHDADNTAGAGAGSVPMVVAALTTADKEPLQSCSDGTVSAAGCRERGVQLARGNECPAASGKYCDDKTPYCCGTPGNYYCAIDVNHC